MEHLNCCLHPGETIRSPRVALLYWQGESLHGHQQLRRFVLAHHCPQEGGQPRPMPLCHAAWGGMPTDGHLALIEQLAEQGLPHDHRVLVRYG